MWQESSIFYEDIKDVSNIEFIPWDALNNQTLLITGATGLIGSTFIKSMVFADKKRNLGIKIIALVRCLEKAMVKFENELKSGILKLVVGSVEKLPKIEGNIDFIVHGASQTMSKEFLLHSVETINTSILGTMNLLELARDKGVKSFVYLSSMEVYGSSENSHKVREEEVGSLSPLSLRNCYPISKLMCESLCCAYESEYRVPAKIIRLTQTLGAEVNENDTRIFAYFAKCVEEKQDIILRTTGETERCYLFATDAVTAILSVMLKGKDGEAYNAADEKTYCSISKMAEKAAMDGGIKVKYEIQDEASNGYPKALHINLDTSKLKNLGWKPGNNIGIG